LNENKWRCWDRTNLETVTFMEESLKTEKIDVSFIGWITPVRKRVGGVSNGSDPN
jgi:hypothetical protein